MSARPGHVPVANPQRVSLNAGLFLRSVEEGLTLEPAAHKAKSIAASAAVHLLFAVIKRHGLTKAEALEAVNVAVDSLDAGNFFDPHKEG